jgi:hypothetical protein
MSTGASFTFLPWLRRGLAAHITHAEGDAGAPERARVEVRLTLDLGAAGVNLELLGAQDVVGFDPRAVVRTWPRADVFDAESNFLALAELDQPDLPWRYTPLAADAQDRLRPWLVLIVLADDEFELAQARSEPEPRPPVLTVRDAGKLPNLSQSWAWAHAHVSGTSAANAAEVATLLDREPHRLVSRLLCPRRLEPRKAYTGFLVPAFRRGTLAALQETADPVPGAFEPAWPAGARGEIRLPVFYHWRFGTGAAGDFESLARALTPLQELPGGVGTRPMNVSAPGLGLPAASASELGLEGALAPPRFARTTWTGATRGRFETELATLIGTPARLVAGPRASDLHAVTPPVYGRWHAALSQRAVAAPLTIGTAPGDPPPWLAELNRDPRMRVAAGLGTLVVQTKQTELMAGAWEQLGSIRQANEALRFAQVAREGSVRVFHRHFTSADDGPLLQLTAPAHSHVRSAEGRGAPTVRSVTSGSVIEGVLQPAWRRIARPRGSLGRRQGRGFADRETQARLDGLLARLNNRSITPAGPPRNPPGLGTLLSVAASVVTDDRRREQLTGMEQLTPKFTLAGTALLVAAFGESYAAPPYWQRLDAWKKMLESATSPGAKQPEEISKIIDAIPGHPDFQAVEFDPKTFQSPFPDQPKEGGQDSNSARDFRTALRELFDRSRVPRRARLAHTVDLSALRAAIVRELDPNLTVAARFRRDLHLDPRIRWNPRDPLEPILAAPTFEEPMYEPLRDLSQDWLLPGLEHVPENKVVLLQTNQRFVEAYMAGLSHEFSRELVWNEYPTDQRGTYFRQFWDPAGHVPADGTSSDRESLRDIREIHLWSSSALGANSPRRLPSGSTREEERLVLLIRGDLLRRYPTATVYATFSSNAGPAPGDPERHPLFRGTLRPDVTFLGFDMTVAQAGAAPVGGRRWYFVLQEQAGETRFGFDEAASGGGLAWTNLAVVGGAHIDVAAVPRLGRTAAEIARSALQQPVRVLIPAASLLPSAS